MNRITPLVLMLTSSLIWWNSWATSRSEAILLSKGECKILGKYLGEKIRGRRVFWQFERQKADPLHTQGACPSELNFEIWIPGAESVDRARLQKLRPEFQLRSLPRVTYMGHTPTLEDGRLVEMTLVFEELKNPQERVLRALDFHHHWREISP
jgi:hypothetical protein